MTKVARTENKKPKITSTAKAKPSRPSTARSSIDCSISGAWSKIDGDGGVVAELLLETWDLGADAVRDLHRIGVGVLENGKAEGWPAVGPSDRCGLDRVHFHVGDRGQRDRTVRGRHL